MSDTKTSNQSVSTEVKAAIRKEAMTQVAKWTIGLLVLLFGIAASGWWLYLQQRLDQYIVSKTASVPSSTVASFDLRECPQGWKSFDDGAGRVVVGAGRGEGLTPRSYRVPGGSENVRLTEANIPAHQHDTLTAVNFTAPWGNAATRPQAVEGTKTGNWPTAQSSSYGKAQPDAVPTMPPFIALTVCIKT
jgi:hypothetical protein